MAYFIAPGKSIITTRGIVTHGDDNDPRISVGCLTRNVKDSGTRHAAEVRLEKLCEKGYLVEGDEPAESEPAESEPAKPEPAKPEPAKPEPAKKRGRGKRATRVTPDPLGGNVGG